MLLRTAVQTSVSKSNSSQKLKLRNNILLVKRNKINIDSEYLSLKANISYAKKYSLILNKQTKKNLLSFTCLGDHSPYD